MNRELSIKHQKEAGTYNRNDLIQTFYQPGLGGALGKRFVNPKTGEPISRQRIHQIKNRKFKKQPWWKFWGK